MAVIDLPVTPGFEGARFDFGLDVSESGFQGFYTGNRQRQSTLADRLFGVLSLPPTNDVELQAQREALIFGLRSAGDTLRMLTPHRKSSLGTISGTVTAGANAAAGARSLSLVGALSRPNLLQNSSFEIDTNADGLANNWISFSTGATGTVSHNLTTDAVVTHGSKRQRTEATALGTGTGDVIGIAQEGVPVTAGLTYTLSGYLSWSALSNATYLVLINWNDGGGALISQSLTTGGSLPGTLLPARFQCTGTAPTGAVQVNVLFLVQARQGGVGSAVLDVDAAQFEQAAAATDYAGYATLLPGSIIGTGGNLLHVGFAGATANDSGAMTVPLSLPLPKAVTSGAAVSLAPTGQWEWDGDAPEFTYTPGRVQGPITIPLRQVIA